MGETRIVPSIPLVPGGGVSATVVTEMSAITVAPIMERYA
jgi:hypothetical protein